MQWSPRTSSPVALLALVAANLVPLAGVLWFGWSLKALLVVYWLESGVIGLLNVPKILLASGTESGTFGSNVSLTINGRQVDTSPPENPRDGVHVYLSNIPIAGFFAMHYGIFWVVHGVFVWSFDQFTGSSIGGVPLVPVLLAAGVTLVTHGGSLLTNFVGNEEYRHISPGGQMSEPYKRVIVLHLTILGGAFLVASAGTPAAALVVMVVVKSVLDVASHVREHTRAKRRSERAGGDRNDDGVGPDPDSEFAL